MIILTNCLTDTADEGAVKVANSLINRIKKQKDYVKVISYERKTQDSDWHVSLNKLMINPRFLSFLYHANEDVLYMPFPARMVPTLMRICVLSLFVKKRIKAVLIMQGHIGGLAKFLLKVNKAEICSISKDSWSKCAEIIGARANYLKVGVDTQRFVSISEKEKKELRRRYNIPEDKVVVLHVGHMKEGRNLRQTLKLNEEFFVLIVTSTFTKNEQDNELKSSLEERKNIKIINAFLPNIEKIYQLADVYFFPVENMGNCIDAPLSVFEAASCNIPVVHTAYGELVELCGKDGFYRIQSFDSDALNQLVSDAISEKKSTRDSILEYDWNKAIDSLCE